MSGINIITANFTNNKRATVTRKLYKGDYGQKIQVKGLDLPEFFQVHFSHDLKNGIAKKIIGQNNEIPIPDEYLLSGNTIYAWIFLHQTEQDGETRHVITIPVIDKPNVVPVQPTPVEQDTMAQVISLLNDAAEEAQAWAVGKRNGEDVSPDDETYQNNSKYYSEQAGIFKEQSESNVRHYPKIIDGYWYFWDIENNKYINSWQKAQGERDSILQTASGNIVYIPDGGANLPIEELIVNITPEQYGSGTPIYYNIRSFKPGMTQVTIETRGKNLFDQSRFPLASFPKITDPNNIYYNSYYGSLRNLGYNSTSIFHVNNGGFVGKVPIDDVVNVSFDIQNVLPRTYLRFFYADGTNSGYNHFIGQNGFYGHYSVHSDENKKVTAVNINTLGNASSYSGIKNLQIERGTEETEYDNYAKSYSINWAETAEPIYGGYIDVIKGKLVKTYDMIQSYQGENLPGQWYSDRDVYNGNNQPTIGAQVVYELTEPVFYQLDPVDIRTILGINNIWADNGLINVKYRADQNLYIEAQLKQAKDSGQFDGRGIDSVVTNNDYTLTFTYTDGETYTTPFSIKGQDGYTPVKGVDYFTEEQINDIISSVTNDALEQLSDANIYRYRGSVERFVDLPNNAKMGDVYNVAQAHEDIPSGTNWAWTGETWDPLGGIVDAADDQQLKEMLQRLHFLVINSQDSDALVGSAIVGQAQVAPQHYTIQNAPYYVITDIIEDQNQLSVTIVDEHRNTKTIYIKDGDKGDTGNGIENISLNDDYTLSVEYTDGTSWISDEPLMGANADWEAAEGEDGYIDNKPDLHAAENGGIAFKSAKATGAYAIALGVVGSVSIQLTGNANATVYTYTGNINTHMANRIKAGEAYASFQGKEALITDIDTNLKTLTLNATLSESNALSKQQITMYFKSASAGNASFSTGYGVMASGHYSHSEGSFTISSGPSAHSEGQSTTASGTSAHSEGQGTTASGTYSHSEGQSTTASGNYAHSEGGFTTASGNYAHAEGQYTTASGTYSHSEGQVTTASGTYSHSEGGQSTASGNYAHAEGLSTSASGMLSHTEGMSTIANHKSQHVTGEFNVEDPSAEAATARGTYVEIVGNGTADNARSNARTLDWSGNQWLAGNLKVGGTGYDDINAKEVATKDYVDNSIGSASTHNTVKTFILEDSDIQGEMFTIIGGTAADIVNVIYNSNDVILRYRHWIEADYPQDKIYRLKEQYINNDNFSASETIFIFEGENHIDDISQNSLIEPTSKLIILSAATANNTTTYTWSVKDETIRADWEAAEGEDGYIANKVPLVKGSGEGSVQGVYDCVARGNNSVAIGERSIAYSKGSYANGVESSTSISITGEAGSTTYTLSVPLSDEHSIQAILSERARILYNSTFYDILNISNDLTTITVDKTLSEQTALNGQSCYITKPSIAFNAGAHAEGSSMAVAACSHSEGTSTVAYGSSSHAEGSSTLATGKYSHAEGRATIASGQSSHAQGRFTVANHKSQHASGEYNVEDSSEAAATARGTYIEIIGNGTADDARSNARTLDWNGNEWVAGKFKMGGTGYDDVNAKEVETAVLASAPLSEPASIVTIKNGEEGMPVKELTFGIEPVQDLHGYDNPWPAGGGKNLLDEDTLYSVFRTSENTFSGDSTQISQVVTNIPQELIGKTVTFSAYISIPSDSGVTNYRVQAKIDGVVTKGNAINKGASGYSSVTFTPASTDDTIRFTWGSGTGTITIKDVQLEVDDSRTAYAPYSNICPITGYTGAEIVRTGKNLFDASSMTEIVNWTVVPFNLKPGTYTMSTNRPSDNGFMMHFMHVSGPQGSNQSLYEGHAVTLTVTKNQNVQLAYRRASGDDLYSNYWFQLELGSEATEYEPFVANDVIPITFPTEAGTVYGGHVEIKDWEAKLVVTHEQITFYDDEPLPGTWVSDRDIYAEDAIPTIGAQVVYELATPIEYQLDPVTLTTIQGLNHIWANTGDIEKLTYIINPSIYELITGTVKSKEDVKDIRVNGTSVVTNGVAEIPVANAITFGVIKAGSGMTVDAETGKITIIAATSGITKSGANKYAPIVPYNQHESTFYGLAKAAGDTTQASSDNAVGTYTDNAKASIKAMLGVGGETQKVTVSGTAPVIVANQNTRYVCGEVVSLDFTPSAEGICDVIFTSGSTVTVLTIPNTVIFPEWFDPTTLEANKTYEISVSDGVYGAVMVW